MAEGGEKFEDGVPVKPEKPVLRNGRPERDRIADGLNVQLGFNERVYKASVIVLEIVGYSSEEAKQLLESDSELALKLMDAVADVVDNSSFKLTISKPNPRITYVNLEFPMRRVAGLMKSSFLPLFRDNDVDFFVEDVNNGVLTLAGNKARKIAGKKAIDAYSDEVKKTNPYYKSMMKIGEYASKINHGDLDALTGGVTDEQLRQFIQEGKKVLEYSRAKISDIEMPENAVFFTGMKEGRKAPSYYGFIDENLALINSTLADIDAGREVNSVWGNSDGRSEKIDYSVMDFALYFEYWKKANYTSESELSAGAISEYVDRELCDKALESMMIFLGEIIRRYTEN